MRIRVPGLLLTPLLLGGCLIGSSDDDDVAGDDDDTTQVGDDDTSGDDDTTSSCETGDPTSDCFRPPSKEFFLCLPELPRDQPVTGTFRFWDLADDLSPEFVSTDGTVYEVWLDGDPEAFAEVPDLAASGEVGVVQRGGCDGEGGFYNALYVLEGTFPGDLVLLTGSTDAEALAGWTVSSESDTESCPGCAGWCEERLHNRATGFTLGAESVSLFQGEEAILGDYRIWVGRSQSASGQVCADMGTELDNWYIVPAPVVE